jgi:hypothetical protein
LVLLAQVWLASPKLDLFCRMQKAKLCFIDFSYMDRFTSVLQYRQHRLKLYLAIVAALVLMRVSGAYTHGMLLIIIWLCDWCLLHCA